MVITYSAPMWKVGCICHMKSRSPMWDLQAGADLNRLDVDGGRQRTSGVKPGDPDSAAWMKPRFLPAERFDLCRNVRTSIKSRRSATATEND